MKFALTTLIFLSVTFFLSAQRMSASKHFEAGSGYFQRDHYDSALFHLNRSIVLRREADVFYTRGLVYEQLGEHNRAIDDFSSAINLRNPFPEAYFKRGKLFLDKGIYRQALDDFNTLLSPDQEGGTKAVFFKIDPRGIDQVKVSTMSTMQSAVKAMRGRTYQAIGEYDKAMKDMNQAVEEDSSSQHLVVRALLYKELGELDAAKRDLLWSVGLDSTNEVAWFNLVLLDNEVALPEGLSNEPSFGPMLAYRAVESFDNGDLEESEILFKRAISLEPESPMLLLNAGKLYAKKGDYRLARNHFSKVLELDDTRFESYYLIANTYFREQAYQKAAAYYEQFLVRDKSNGAVWYNAGSTYLALKNKPQGCRYLERAIARGMQNAETLFQRNCTSK